MVSPLHTQRLEERVRRLAREPAAEVVHQWVHAQAYTPDDIVLGDQGLTAAQLPDLHKLLDKLDPEWRQHVYFPTTTGAT